LRAPWREVLRALRRMEARGEIRGGRFVGGFSGEQYALPEAVGLLRAVRKDGARGELVAVTGADPLNLLGTIVPGEPVAGHAGNRVLYRDGVPVAVIEGKGEGGRGKSVRLLIEATAEEAQAFETALVRRRPAPLVRAYLGKSRAG
jgi:ATP-dependent Lhr-like helicase